MVTDQPKVGDIVCYDESRKIKFIALDTFHAGTFPGAWETVGVVVLRKGNKVTICSKYNESKKFMEVYPYIVTGYTLDGTEHSATLKLHGSETKEFKYTANTDSEFLSDLKNFLTTNGFGDWSTYIMAGKVYLQYDNYTDLEYPNASVTQATGLILSSIFEGTYEVGSYFMMKCGVVGNGVWNAGRAKEYFANDNSNTAYNPATDISSIPIRPVCWPAFAGTSEYQSDHCLWLRQRYCKDPNHPKKEEWESYIEDLTHKIPCMTGGHAPKWRDGMVLSGKARDVEYQATDGSRKKLFTGIAYCSEFMDGDGYLPSLEEFLEAFGGVTYGLSGVTWNNADPINRSLYAIGGIGVGVTSGFWTSSGMGRASNWYPSFYGTVDGYGLLCGQNRCIPFARLTLPEE